MIARPEPALEEDVADHPPLAGDGLERENARAGHVLAVEAAIAPAEELVAAAYREHGVAPSHRLPEPVRLRGEVARDEQLLAIMTAADVEEVVLVGPHRISHADRRHLEPVAAPLRAA